MSKDRQQPFAEPSNLAVLRASLASRLPALARRIWSWVLDNKQLSIAAAAIVLLTIPVVGTLVVRHWRAEAMKPSTWKMTTLLDETLKAVDKGKFREAQKLVKKLDLAFLHREQMTTVEYILGAIDADEAEEYVGADRTPRFRNAVEHLTRSRELGFPLGHEAAATFLLGKSLFHGDKPVESRPFLEESLTLSPKRAAEIHGMLADAYRWGESPNLAKAIEHNTTYLASAGLSNDERQVAELREAELRWETGDFDACGKVVAKIPADSPEYATASIIRGRLLLHEAGQAQAALPADADEAARKQVREKFQAALTVLRRAQQDPLNTKVIGRAMYLIGVCYLKLDDTQAALDQLKRTSRVYENTPEGLAAGLEEADLLRRLGRSDEAVKGYIRVFDGAALTDTSKVDNPWISREQFRTRALDAYHYYVERGEFERATALVDHLTPLVQPARAAELAAELRRDWARRTIDDAERLSEPVASEGLKQGRKMLREAGLLFAQAAKLNFSERQYPDDVWQSAECYRQGHNFTAAAKGYEDYMKYEVKRRRSAALVGLGECLLSLDRYVASLAVLKQCYELMPDDAASYNARLLASKAYLELGKPAEAEALLRENIGGNLLTPDSKEWRDSLFALGKLLVTNEHHEEAIKVLSEAVARYPDTKQSIEARYLIAEEYRRAAKVPQEKIESDTIETARVAHLRQLQQFLAAAVEQYEDVQRLLNRQQEREDLSLLEQAILRNSYFAVGMSLMDLGRYEDAIRAYSTATNRYQHTPEVLEAFVQIASCYRRLNRPLEARGAVRQAKVVLNRLPENAPYQQATNFTRKQWVDLLDWLVTL